MPWLGGVAPHQSQDHSRTTSSNGPWLAVMVHFAHSETSYILYRERWLVSSRAILSSSSVLYSLSTWSNKLWLERTVLIQLSLACLHSAPPNIRQRDSYGYYLYTPRSVHHPFRRVAGAKVEVRQNYAEPHGAVQRAVQPRNLGIHKVIVLFKNWTDAKYHRH
jgi:hypothetical protein